MREHTYVIVGGGTAAARAAEAVRARDATGSIAIFTREWAPPYQRPPLSKEFLQGRAPIEDALMFPPGWYPEHDVDLYCGVEVTRLDPARKVVETAGGQLAYGRLLLATGASARTLRLPGADLDGVYVLRSYLDAERLSGVRAGARRVVVLGSGFIGMEAAASLRSAGCEVTVVTLDAALYERFGERVSAFAKRLFDDHGVEVVLKTSIASLEGDRRVERVTLTDGRRIEANAVLIGVGAKPETTLAEQAGLRVEDGIVVDAQLRTSVPDVYAAGDVARFPALSGGSVRVEHFDNAYIGGAVAGANMAGAGESYRYVPFFWSDVFDLNFEFVGEPAATSVLTAGSIEEQSFVLEYRDGDRSTGALFARRSAEERDAYRNRLAAVS